MLITFSITQEPTHALAVLIDRSEGFKHLCSRTPALAGSARAVKVPLVSTSHRAALSGSPLFRKGRS